MAALPRKLERSDTVEGFDSGAPELDAWLVRYAYTNLRANNAITYVSVDGDRVIGYYAIAMAGVELATVPSKLQTARPQQVPCLMLGRLAVDKSAWHQGLGAGLLQDALVRAVSLSDVVGAAAVLVHARDQVAKDFYLHNGDFLESPLDPLQLFVPMKVLRRIYGDRPSAP